MQLAVVAGGIVVAGVGSGVGQRSGHTVLRNGAAVTERNYLGQR